MENFAVTVLLFISSILGVSSIPSSSSHWVSNGEWKEEKGKYVYSAFSESIWQECFRNGSGVIEFPQVVHGVHKIKVNGVLVRQTGDDSFSKVSSFYNRDSVDCNLITEKSKVEWEVISYSKYFSRIKNYPIFKKSGAFSFFFDVVANILAAGGLLILSIFSFVIFKDRVQAKSAASLSIGAISWAIYSVMSVGNYFGISISMLSSHKIADFFVWFGCWFYFYFFSKTKYLYSFLFNLYTISFIIGSLIILNGNNGDVVQFGTSIPMPFAMICFINILFVSLFTFHKRKANKASVIEFISSFCFVLACVNDIFNVLGVGYSFILVSIGATSGVLFLAVAVNQDIENTYKERDILVTQLESKVADKTQHLTLALENLQKSQAELVHSARLASLGTLSAGIAHEINNSINYVSGALVPLERRVMKIVPEADKPMFDKLFSAIKEGTKLTVDIVRSLRSYTGMNQAKVKDVDMLEVVTSVLTILRNRTKDIQVHVDISPGLQFLGHQVGVNQILMNIISNSIDAIDHGTGQIWIKSYTKDTDVLLEIKDNGCGMPTEVQNRIFDPFFTTKEVGKGTGLGMHIVKNEVDRHKGQIKIESEFGKGTTFIITFPQIAISDINLEAS